MGDNWSALRRTPTPSTNLVEKMGAIQHYVMMVLTGQAHLLQHMEETHDVLQKTRADVELLKTMYQELLELIHAESGQTVEEACSPMESKRNPRGRSPDTDSRRDAVKAQRTVMFPEPESPESLVVEQSESPQTPLMMAEDLKKSLSDGGPSTPTILDEETPSPLSTISSIMQKSPGGKKWIADCINILENQHSHDAKYYRN